MAPPYWKFNNSLIQDTVYVKCMYENLLKWINELKSSSEDPRVQWEILKYYIIQIMPGLEGDLEEWQTQEVNVTRGEAEGDIDLGGLPFLKVTRGPRHYLFCYSRQFYIFMHILIFTIFIQTHSFLWGIILLDL